MPSLAEARSLNAKLKLQSPIAVVVGGTAGIGAALALKIAQYSTQPQIHLIGRSQEGALKVINELKAINDKGSYEFHQCDVSLLSNVRTVATELKTKLPRINFLVLSSGILSMSGRTETPEGLDIKMALHFYSRMLFAQELSANLVKASADGQPARVISVLDSLRANPNKVLWNDLPLKTNYSLGNAAQHCMSMTNAVFQHNASTNPGVAYMHAYPGLVATSLARGISWLPSFSGTFGRLIATSPADCAEYLMSSLAAPENQKGFYCVDSSGKILTNVPQATKEQEEQIVHHVAHTFAPYT